MYAPLNPESSNRVLLVRAGNGPASMPPWINNLARNLKPDVIPDAHLLSKDFSAGSGETRALSRVFSLLGVLALSITCVGIFGTISFAATLRQQEIGIRIALGARQESMILLLLRQLCWPVIGGLALGLAAMFPFSRLFAGVPAFATPFDPLAIAIVVVFLIAITGFSAVLPALWMLRSNPLQSLRSE
jgi:ABC-type antimicrobial peptide transport system permease subunit